MAAPFCFLAHSRMSEAAAWALANVPVRRYPPVGASQSIISPATNTPGSRLSINVPSWKASTATPPDEEMAESKPWHAPSCNGTSLTISASFSGSLSMATSCPAACRISPATTGGIFSAFLSRELKEAFLRAGLDSRFATSLRLMPGLKSMCRTAAVVEAACEATISEERAHTAPPSMPSLVTIRSPREEWPSNASCTSFTGVPAWHKAYSLDQGTLKPTLFGRSAVTDTPIASSLLAHFPSEPSFAQLAPPRASRMASAWTMCSTPHESTILRGGGWSSSRS
mmetsp:Transcript_32615/g.92481  ORF Transcript_32615/g.92481 Transcript_32615/m.92481 type:complete len:283 (-) Transcript_32615:646-1494(-)